MVCDRCKNNENTLIFGTKQCEESSDCAVHATKYNSIFNIVNEDDFIPNFQLSQWYFTRYGRTTQGVKIDDSQTSYSTLWTNSWEDHDGNALATQYMRMENPVEPLNLLYEAARRRTDCYYPLTGDEECVELSSSPSYPTNTTGYYNIDVIIGENGQHIWRVYQSPMFLMKYFAAVATENASKSEFYTLNVASYLEEAKVKMLEQTTGYPYLMIPVHVFTLNLDRINHPHLPQSYCLLACNISLTDYS